ncbi:type II toxin-antitoxin system VapC family toxin [Microbacterium sp.]|uniref:type II toxin-antitoxin system VapC family toxin n=1 Tax=Microbacterium sp. TaxID=51671 RepID=UPI003A9511A0
MTAVLDASVLVELLMMSPLGRLAVPQVQAAAGDLHIPHLADTETLSVLRGLVVGGVVSSARAEQALSDLSDLPVRRWPALPLFERVWQLRANATAYDATYVALAEVLGARLVTADERLVRGMQGLAHCELVLIRSE